MATNSKCIVIQGHIPHTIDVQGNLTPERKVQLLSLAIWHLRFKNPDAYIILTGHGERLTDEAYKVADAFYWEDKCRPLDPNGYVDNMPGQFWFIWKGLKLAQEAGFHDVLKTRLDCVIGIPDIVDYCSSILEKENKDLLLTQQTGWNLRCGDCLLYGDINILLDIFNEANSVYSGDGLLNTGHWALYALSQRATAMGNSHAVLHDKNDKTRWRYLLNTYCSFRDTVSLRFSDLRWNGNLLLDKYGIDRLTDDFVKDNFNYRRYAWGSPQWHGFADDGTMVHRCLDDLVSEKEFYNK